MSEPSTKFLQNRIDSVEGLLHRQKLRQLRFESAYLEKAFKEYFREHVICLLRQNAVLTTLFFITYCLGTFIFIPSWLHKTWIGLGLTVGASILICLGPCWLSKNARTERWVALAAFFSISVQIFAIGFLPGLQFFLAITTLMLIFSATCCTLLSFKAAAISLGSALTIGTIFLNVLQTDSSQPLVLVALIMGGILSLGICYLNEQLIRHNFLQCYLLGMEKKQLRILSHQLRAENRTDELTGIPNRRYFDHYFQREWLRCYRIQAPLSALFIDIDHYKKYNDFYGHHEGDQCLIKLAHALDSQVLRPSDLVARWGGEEFVVLLPETDSLGAIQVAEALHQEIKNLAIPHEESPIAPYVTISIGVASIIPNIDSLPIQFLRAADEALYEAKSSGRNRSHSIDLTEEDVAQHFAETEAETVKEINKTSSLATMNLYPALKDITRMKDIQKTEIIKTESLNLEDRASDVIKSDTPKAASGIN
ncbi:MAG: diguanylate cyclase [Pseudomonadota bacterium]